MFAICFGCCWLCPSFITPWLLVYILSCWNPLRSYILARIHCFWWSGRPPFCCMNPQVVFQDVADDAQIVNLLFAAMTAAQLDVQERSKHRGSSKDYQELAAARLSAGSSDMFRQKPWVNPFKKETMLTAFNHRRLFLVHIIYIFFIKRYQLLWRLARAQGYVDLLNKTICPGTFLRSKWHQLKTSVYNNITLFKRSMRRLSLKDKFDHLLQLHHSRLRSSLRPQELLACSAFWPF